MRFATMLGLILVIHSQSHAQTTVNWTNGEPNDSGWSTAGNWSPEMVPNNDDMNSYNAILNGASVDLSEMITVSSLVLNQGAAGGVTINGGGQTLTVEGNTTSDDGRFIGGGTFDSNGMVDVSRSLRVGGSWQFNTDHMVVGTGGANGSLTLQDDGRINIDGTLEFLRDSSVGDAGGSNRLLSVMGTFRKSGGAGQSSVTAPFALVAGTLDVSSGTLAFFGNTDIDGTLSPSGSATIVFSGDTTISGTIDMSDSGSIQFNGANLNSITLDGSGTDASFVKAGSGTFMQNATLNLSNASTPFIFEGNSMSSVTNHGFFEWHLGLVTDMGFSNESGATVETRLGGIGTPGITDALFTNNGTVIVNRSIDMNDGAMINHSGGEWRFTGGNTSLIGRGPGEQTSLFTQTGTLVMNSPGAFGFSQVTAPITSTGVIDVQNGELRFANQFPDKIRLQGPIVAVDGGNGNGALFSLGANGLSTSKTEGVSFTFQNNGAAAWRAGTHKIEGDITSGGFGVVRNDGATMLAESGQAANLRCDANAPFTMNSNNANLQADGTITNKDRIHWISGAVIGPMAAGRGMNMGEFVNDTGAIIDVQSVMTISRGDGGSVRNNGMIQLTGNAFTGIGIDANGKLINATDGTITFTGDQNITPALFGSGPGTLENLGIVQKTGGGINSLITVNYQQSGDAALQSNSGAIALGGDLIELMGGTLEANGADSKVLVEKSSTTENVAFKFTGDGIVEYKTLSGATVHEIIGTLGSAEGSGQGTLRLSGGTMRPRDTSATLQIIGDGKFQQTGGTLGEAGSFLSNRGNAEMTGGMLTGDYSNTSEGDFFFDGGTIRGTFSNDNTFEWSRGTLDAQMTNSVNGRIDLSAEDDVLLAAGGKVTNNNEIHHSGIGDLELGEDAEIVNPAAAEYVFSNGGDIRRVGNAIQNARFTNTGRVANSSGVSSSINVRFSSTGGTIETEDIGELAINGVIGESGGQPILNGGLLKSAAGAVKTFNAKLMSGLNHDHGNGGAIEHTIPEIDASFLGTGRGTTTFLGGETPDGGGLFALVGSDTTTYVLKNTMDIAADVTTSDAIIHFENTKYNFFKNSDLGTFNANSDVVFESTGSGGRVILKGPASGDRQTFTLQESRTATLIGGSDMILDGFVEFVNNGTFEIEAVGAGIARFTSIGTDTFFNNNGVFRKVVDESVGLSLNNVRFDNSGTVHASEGQLAFTDCITLNGTTLEQGTWIVEDAKSLSLNGGASSPILTNNATIKMRGPDASFDNLPDGQNVDFLNDDNGNLMLQNGATLTIGGEFENDGTVTVDAQSALIVGTVDNDGTMTINGTLGFGQESRWQSGKLDGTGTVNGTRLISSADVAPGNSPGRLTINAEFINETSGTITIELAGTTPESEHDVLSINGPLTLAGTLDVQLLDEFEPASGDSFTVVTAGSISGSFDNAPNAGGVGVLMTPDGEFSVNYFADSIVLSDFVPSVNIAVGDMNCDGFVDGNDIDGFVLALIDPVGYAARFPACDALNADTNNDGAVGVNDTSGFVALLTGS